MLSKPFRPRLQHTLITLPPEASVHPLIDMQDHRITSVKAQIASLAQKRAALNNTVAWLEQPLKLAPSRASQWYHLIDAKADGRLLCERESGPTALPTPHIFLIEHDWASAFANATDLAATDIHPPYPCAAYEFTVTGRHVIALMNQNDLRIFVAVNGCWCELSQINSEIGTMVQRQVRAVAIMLDAKVAVETVREEPHRLNQHRAAVGRSAINSFHTLELSRPRHRMHASTSNQCTSIRRLHFRRGHWRKYADYRRWINWMLVGDPDLGAIDKHYSL